MNINHIRSLVLRLAVTVAFVTGAIAVTAIIWALQWSDGNSPSTYSDLAWLHAGRVTVSYALLSGLVVDSIRLLFDLDWRNEGSVGLRSK